MSSSVSVSIIADDIFEKIMVDKKFGTSFLKRVSADEFGPSVYVTNMTVVSFLQKYNYNSKIVQRVKRLLYFLPQYDNRKRMKRSLIVEEPVRGQIWGETVDWFIRHSMPKSENKVKLTLVNWADVGVLKYILKIYRGSAETSYIVTQNPNYAKVAEMSRTNKEFPKFQIIS
ncbi:MAG: hypothetical protein EPO62_05115 [Candidatus Nitrosotenuis sp.]|nr:MAG: hypothetical protein EPO62_05115 [Candidatus Nitrosotenuis sp.]